MSNQSKLADRNSISNKVFVIQCIENVQCKYWISAIVQGLNELQLQGSRVDYDPACTQQVHMLQFRSDLKQPLSPIWQ